MSAAPSTTAGGATSITASDAESSDMAVTKIANTQKDTEAATATDNVPPPVSHPIDPNAPSFLNLPGEVRNAIYEALFIHEYPIQIHAKNINRLGYHSGYRSDSIISGTALLQSCCQIQHEATGVLYARNVFRLRLPEDADERSGTIWAMDWLRIIGKQASSLRVIQLDVNNLLDADETLEVLPILEYTWKLEHKEMNVLFVAPPEVHSSMLYFQSNREWSASHMAKINESLSTLTADPSNLLRKYWISKMLLRVGLDTDESKVYVSYRHNDSGGGNWMTKGRMSISDEGELRVIPPNRNTDFCDLMSIYSVRKRLFDLFQPPGVELTFDLAHQTTNSNLRSLAGLNRWLRHEAISEVCDINSTFNSVTSTPKYNFATELERFTAIRLRGRPRYFHLYFDLPKHSTLEDVRFDALLLLSAMDSVNRKVHLEIEVRHPVDSETPNHCFTLSLDQLKVGVLLFIYDFLKTYPNRADLPCPTIWTNGFGQAKEASWQNELGLDTLVNSYLDNSYKVTGWVDYKLTNDWNWLVNSHLGPCVKGSLLEFLRKSHRWGYRYDLTILSG
ncbi:hypothetical protein J4E80_006265 [Alternaria sp. BMP 0032]|nr:hypothetical protein J4E80_006265 [Alternaria sp. BMP 0032]